MQLFDCPRGPQLARNSGKRTGRACLLCPDISDVSLLRYRERVVDLDTKVADGALDLGVPEQELDGPQITGAPIDQGHLRAP